MSDTVICKNKRCLKEIDAAYTDADRDGWDSEAARRFEKLTQTLPDKTWLE